MFGRGEKSGERARERGTKKREGGGLYRDEGDGVQKHRRKLRESRGEKKREGQRRAGIG